MTLVGALGEVATFMLGVEALAGDWREAALVAVTVKV
jgi:uncharacterized membrane protein (DUF4010 family)